MLRVYIALFLFLGLAIAAFHDDMKALEKELESLHLKRASKKSINDMTTEELINELKREVNKIGTSHHAAFRSKFDDILTKKSDEEVLWENTLSSMQAEENYKREDDVCLDLRNDCNELKPYCESHRAKLADSCKRTCGWCPKTCKDKYESCQAFASSGECHKQSERMSEVCPKACGFCKVPAPSKCSQSQYGCCWNKETSKQDKEGSNCPACKDQYKYVCDTFDVDCGSYRSAGDFMRRYCPNTCNICSNTACTDAPTKAFYCPLWKKQLDWCTTKKDVMTQYCPKTCGYC